MLNCPLRTCVLAAVPGMPAAAGSKIGARRAAFSGLPQASGPMCTVGTQYQEPCATSPCATHCYSSTKSSQDIPTSWSCVLSRKRCSHVTSSHVHPKPDSDPNRDYNNNPANPKYNPDPQPSRNPNPSPSYAGSGAAQGGGGLPLGFKRQPALPVMGLKNSLTSIAEAGAISAAHPARTAVA